MYESYVEQLPCKYVQRVYYSLFVDYTYLRREVVLTLLRLHTEHHGVSYRECFVVPYTIISRLTEYVRQVGATKRF